MLSCQIRSSRTSLEVIGTDTDRSATYDFLFVIHNNHGPISYTVSEINGKSRNIFPPGLFNAPAKGSPLKFRNGGVAKK